jgi:uncharacterized protein
MVQTAQQHGATPSTDVDVSTRLASYRQTRERLERSVLPLATSVDGTSFTLQASLHRLDVRRGGYVALETEDGPRLGLVTDVRADTVTASGDGDTGGTMVRLAAGDGVVLDRSARPFHDAEVRPARPDEVSRWVREDVARSRSGRAGLPVGELAMSPGVTAELDSGGLGRHTFLCGQSGSGKTYSLGVLLEQVLQDTALRLVILDPNSDHVGLGTVRDDVDPALAERYRAVTDDVTVWGGPAADQRLHLRLVDLDPAAQATVLGLDPLRDRDEYATLLDLVEATRSGHPVVVDPRDLLESPNESARRLGMRARNLGVLDWSLWGPTQRSLIAELRAPTARCTVVDTGSLPTVEEQRVVYQAVLATLWEERLSRNPCLVVIDEAHNVCPLQPLDPMTAMSSRHAVQLAGEGRKFGIYLLVSTQRPHKVHPDVVSQCDNLILMRMNSDADLGEISRVFSFVPPGLVRGATGFSQGEALVGGRLVPQAGYVRLGARLSQEGGADVPATWAKTLPDAGSAR